MDITTELLRFYYEGVDSVVEALQKRFRQLGRFRNSTSNKVMFPQKNELKCVTISQPGIYIIRHINCYSGFVK